MAKLTKIQRRVLRRAGIVDTYMPSRVAILDKLIKRGYLWTEHIPLTPNPFGADWGVDYLRLTAKGQAALR